MDISWKNCFRICFSVFLLFICMEYFDKGMSFLGLILAAAEPLILGGIIAYFLNILMCFYERHYFTKSKSTIVIKSRRPVCILLAIISLLVVVTLIVYLVLPQLTFCVKLILAELPGVLRNFVSRIANLKIVPENIIEKLYSVNWQSKIGQIVNIIVSGIGNVADVVINTVSTIASAVATTFIGIVFAVYLLLGKEKIAGQINKLANRFMKKEYIKRIAHCVSLVNNCFHRYIVGQCTEAVILGVLCAIGMMILRLPYAAMTGALIGFTALIPVAGAYIGAGVGAFMIFTVSPVKALIFLIFIVILQQFEGNFIYPKVVGSSLGLPALWVLAAVTVGGGIMGIVGMLLGVPLAAVIYTAVSEMVNEPESINKTEVICDEKTD